MSKLDRFVKPAATGLFLFAAMLALLQGCVIHVDGGHEDAAWSSYRAARNALELVVTLSPTDAPVKPGDGAQPVGTWTGTGNWAAAGDGSERWVSLETRRATSDGRVRTVLVVSTEDLVGLPQSDDGPGPQALRYRISREAGTLAFEGERRARRATGDVRLEPDASFLADLRRLVGTDPTASQLLSLITADIRGSFVRDLAELGYTLGPEEVVRLRNNGVTAGYLRGIKGAGQPVPVDDAIRMHNNGVSADAARTFREEAGRPLSTDDIVRLRAHGVTPEFVRELRSDSDAEITVDDIIRLRNNGVTARYVRDVRGAGPSFSPDDIVRLRNNGVSAAFVKGLKDSGYDLPAAEIVRLVQSGVPIDYIRDLRQPGKPNLGVDAIIEARNRGLSAEFVNKLRKD